MRQIEKLLSQVVSKLFLTLKNVSLLILISSLTTLQIVEAKDITPIYLMQVDGGKTLKDVFNELKEKTGYKVFYNSSDVDVTLNTDYEFKNASVEEILSELLKDTDLSYKIIGDQILIYKKNQNTSSMNINALEQELRQIQGIVKDDTGAPLPGVNVIIKGTTKGSITDLDGHYTLEVANTDILVFSFVGFDNKEVSVGSQTEINVSLEAQVDELEEVVVTAFGIEKEKKAIGYSVQQVQSDQLTDTRTTNVGANLAGKVAGVQVNTSGGVGGTVSVRVRGSSSISGNNEPLWVVDGVPINSTQMLQLTEKDVNIAWGAANQDGGISDINPEDIESMTVLKGPNAAALYGSRAQNGAIIITTKKGMKEDGIKVEFNSNTMFEQVYDFYHMQDIYGQGVSGRADINAGGSWGAPMEGQPIQSWVDPTKKVAYSPSDQWKDFYKTGTSFSNNIAISGGKGISNFRVSFMDQRTDDIYPGHTMNKNSLDFQGGLKTEKFFMNGKFNYISHKEDGGISNGYTGTTTQFVEMPRSIRTEDIANNYYDPVTELPLNWSGLSSKYLNPYWQSYNTSLDGKTRDRFITMLSAGYTFNDWLNITGKTGIDYYDETREMRILPQQPSLLDKNYKVDSYKVYEMNSDLMLNANKQFGDFGVSASLGTNIMTQERSGIGSQGKGQIVPGIWSLPNSASIVTTQMSYEKQIQSVFGFGQFSYRNYLFLDWTARNDWSSTLPADNRSYFYPSVTGSMVVSDMLEDFNMSLPSWMTYLKMRGAWAKVGNDTDPYMLAGTYNIVQGPAGPVAQPPLELQNANLKPEETISSEFGAEVRFLNNRIYVDFATYKSNTFNQILTVPMTSSSGYQYKVINAGDIENRGIEFMFNATVIKKANLSWDIGFNFAKNRTYVNELAEGVDIYEMANAPINVSVVAQEGEAYGNIRSTRSFVYDENGNKMIGNDGLPLTSNTPEVIGNIQADWTGSINTAVQYKNFSFRTQIDIKKGGDMYSYSDATGTMQGNSERTLEGRDGTMVIEGINAETGQPNTQKISSEEYWNHIGGSNAVGSEFIYDASYVSLREVSVGYSIPSHLLNNLFIEKLRISAVGRNLFYLKTNMPGGVSPEAYVGPTDGYSAMEIGGYPMSRNFGFNLNVTF